MSRNLVVVAVVLALLVSLPMAAAQEPTGVACDSTLATLLVLAVLDYSYQPTIDLAEYNFGQYSVLLNAAQTVAQAAVTMEEAGAAAEAALGEAADQLQEAAGQASEAGAPAVGEALGAAAEAVEGVGETVGAALESGQEGLENTQSSVMLFSGMIPGEPAVCTALRAELEAFFLAELPARLEKTAE